MDRDTGVALIKQQLSFRQSGDSAIVQQMQLAQTTLEASPVKPWFLINVVSSLVTVASTRTVAVPTGFIEEVDEAGLIYVPDDTDEEPVQLVKDDFDELSAKFARVAAGPPKAYALLGDNFYLFPLPDDVYTLHLYQYKDDLPLTSNIENGWLKHIPLLLLGTALQFIANGPLRDSVAAGIGTQWVAEGSRLLNVRNESRKRANTDMQIGGRHW